MTAIDVDGALRSLSDQLPSGEDLYEDTAFRQMESAAYFEPDPHFGDPVEPDWPTVWMEASQLLSQTKDLRVAIFSARAALGAHGLPEFRDALVVIQGYIEDYWDSFHPQLEDGDPTYRVNQLRALRDWDATLSLLHGVPLFQSESASVLRIRNVVNADGQPVFNDKTDPDRPAMPVETILMDADVELIVQTAYVIADAVTLIERIESLVNEKVATSGADENIRLANRLSLKPLSRILIAAQEVLESFAMAGDAVERRHSNESVKNTVPIQSTATRTEITEPSQSDRSTGGTVQDRGICSADEAKLALEAVRDFYLTNEPSSPIPQLLTLAARIVSKNYFEIMDILTPEVLQVLDALEKQQQERSQP